MVGGFADRYLLYFVCVSCINVNTLLQRGYILVGLLDAQWGRSALKWGCLYHHVEFDYILNLYVLSIVSFITIVGLYVLYVMQC